jgi:hypothetical protein
VESDVRFFRRRASEEIAAAARAVTEAARERRMQLARAFLEKVEELEARGIGSERELIGVKSSRYRSLEDA